jgi:hypothetical protein
MEGMVDDWQCRPQQRKATIYTRCQPIYYSRSYWICFTSRVFVSTDCLELSTSGCFGVAHLVCVDDRRRELFWRAGRCRLAVAVFQKIFYFEALAIGTSSSRVSSKNTCNVAARNGGHAFACPHSSRCDVWCNDGVRALSQTGFHQWLVFEDVQTWSFIISIEESELEWSVQTCKASVIVHCGAKQHCRA